MKRSLIAAYLALLITLVPAFCLVWGNGDSSSGARPSPSPGLTAAPAALKASEDISAPVPTVHPNPSPSPEAVIAAGEPAPERLLVKCGPEVYDVEMQEYLKGVVAAEMPAYFEPEALKAQAVAARTYAMYCAATGRHSDAQVCTDYSCCQAWISREDMENNWGDNFEENYEAVSRAVDETAGEYLCYNGEPVFAAFHSSSCGATEDCGAIWNPLPYLVSVSSPETADTVPDYISQVELSPLDFRDTVLSSYPYADFTGEEKQLGRTDKSGGQRPCCLRRSWRGGDLRH